MDAETRLDTPEMLKNLDDMMSEMEAVAFGKQRPRDPYLSQKISNYLKWLTGAIDSKALKKMIKDGRFVNGDAMLDLIDNPVFNVSKYDA